MGPKKREHSVSFRDYAVSLHSQGKSYRQIAAIMKVSFSTIRSIVMKYKTTGTTENKPRSGRPRVPNPKNRRTVLGQEHSLGFKNSSGLDSTSASQEKDIKKERKRKKGAGSNPHLMNMETVYVEESQPEERMPSPVKAEPEPEDESYEYYGQKLCEVELRDCTDEKIQTWMPQCENEEGNSYVETLHNAEQEVQSKLPEQVVTSSAKVDDTADRQQCNLKTLVKSRLRNSRKEEKRYTGEAYGIHKFKINTDEFAMYGEHIGSRMKKLNPRAQMCVKNLINVILFKAEVGYYDFPQAPLEYLSENT